MNHAKTASDCRAALMQKKQENARLIEDIKQLNHQIEDLKWAIPQLGEKEEIEELKQSILIPMTTIELGEDFEMVKKDLEAQVRKCYEPKIIKHLENRKEALQKLEKIKVESSLYNSHRRVILKEYLEKLRNDNQILKEVNNTRELGLVSSDMQALLDQYKQLLKQADQSSEDQSVSRHL